jgi:predicted GNAT family acetyltransferase
MSEISALKRLVGAADAPKPAAKTLAQTPTGKTVDLSKGYKVKGPDGLTIPFRPDTPLPKAKEWTKNFYGKYKEKEVESLLEQKPDEADKKTTQFRIEADSPGINWLAFEKDDVNNTYTVRQSQLSQENKGKGIGAGMYRQLFEKAKKEGATVRSDSGMTEASIAVWRRFKELGYPIVEHPMERMPSGANKRKGASLDKDAPLFEYDPGPTDSQVNSTARKLRDKEVPKELREALNAEMLAWNETRDPKAGRELMSRLERVATQADENKKEAPVLKTEKDAPPKPKSKPLPGLYLDEETGDYYRIGKNGEIAHVDISDTTTNSITEAK